MADHYQYTEIVNSLFEERSAAMPGFYCRQDAIKAYKRYRAAGEDTRRFRLHRLKKITDSFQLDLQEVLDHPKILNSLPTREEALDGLPVLFHDLAVSSPSAADYMERIVRRLSPEYGKDTVRTAILKKFLLATGKDWKEMKTSAILQEAMARLDGMHLAVFRLANEKKKLEMLVNSLDDSIFTAERLNPGLSDIETLNLMIRRFDTLAEDLETFDSKGRPVFVEDIPVSEETRKRMGIRPHDSVIRYMKQAAENHQDKDLSFVSALEEDFTRLLSETYYVPAKGNNSLKKAYELYKTDRRDLKDRKGEQWELLKICDDFAAGRFKPNGGKTRLYLYYFAMVFDMTVTHKETKERTPGQDGYDPATNLVKNLFEDYYNDNLVRYLRDEFADVRTAKMYEREPTGEGINYKNPVEVLLLYYLLRKELPYTAGQRIDRVRTILRKSRNLAEETPPMMQKTEVYRRRMEEILETDEEDLPAYISEHFDVTASPGTSDIAVSDEENTAWNILGELLDEVDESMPGSDNDSPIFQNAPERFLETTPFAAKLIDKYHDEEGFVRLVDNLDRRIQSGILWAGMNRLQFLLDVLYSLDETDQRLEKLEKKLGVSARVINDAVNALRTAGFEIIKKTPKNNDEKGSYFTLKTSGYDDPALSRILKKEDGSAELLAEKLTAFRRMTRTQLIAECTNYYFILMQDSEKMESLQELYEDYASVVDPYLTEARFQPFSLRNIVDLYLLLALSYSLQENE